jgi:hypothetical protein
MQRGRRINRTAFIVGSTSALAACSAASPDLVGQRVGADSTGDTLRGRWKIIAMPSKTLLDVQFASGGHERIQTQYLIAGESAMRSPSGSPIAKSASVKFVLNRGRRLEGVLMSDAGNIVLAGYSRFSPHIKSSARGDASFQPRPAYFQELSELGLVPSPLQKVSLALWRVGLRDVRIITTRFPDATLNTVVMLYIFGYSAADAQQLKAKMPHLTAAQLLAKLPSGFPKESP